MTLSTNMDAMRSAQHEKDLKREEDKIANKVLYTDLLSSIKISSSIMQIIAAENFRFENLAILFSTSVDEN